MTARSRNGKRTYSDEDVRRVLGNARSIGITATAYWLGMSKHTIRTWKYGPRGQRVNHGR